MAKWLATRITATAAQNLQINAGLIVDLFDIKNPAEPKDENIVCETTGDFSITCVPETDDFFADVNNAPRNTVEGKRITGWNCGLGVTALSINAETLALALGASEATTDATGVTPRRQYKQSDFKPLYWLGDMVDEEKLFVVVMDNTVSTGGLSFTSTDQGKGRLALSLTPHASLNAQDKIPMAFYILEKV